MQNPFTINSKRKQEQEVLDSELVGYDDLKDFLSRLMQDPSRSMNIMFLGSSATGKTRILDYIRYRYGKVIKDAIIVYHNVETSTGRGIIWDMIQALLQNKEKQKRLFGKFRPEKEKEVWLFLDELDKIKVKAELNQLLTLLENKTINYKVHRKQYLITNIKLKIFATTNSIDPLPRPFLNRFMVFKLRRYTKEQLVHIAKSLSPAYIKNVKTHQEREQIAEEIVNVLWELRKRTVRKATQVMEMYDLYRQEKTIKEIFEFTQKYNSTEEEDEDDIDDEIDSTEEEEEEIEESDGVERL